MLGRAAIETEIQSSFPTNNSKFISAAIMRAFQQIMKDSYFNLIDDSLDSVPISLPDLVATDASGAFAEILQIINRMRPMFFVRFDIARNGSGGLTVSNLTSNNPSLVLTTSPFANASNPVLRFEYDNVFTTIGFGIRKTENIIQGLNIVSDVWIPIGNNSGTREHKIDFYPSHEKYII